MAEWRNGINNLPSHSGVLRIKGQSGTDKSTLMRHTLECCKAIFSGHLIAAYFFNARGSTLEKNPMSMLQTIVYQLLNKENMLYDQLILYFVGSKSSAKDGDGNGNNKDSRLSSLL